jgi:hypothetical protein
VTAAVGFLEALASSLPATANGTPTPPLVATDPRTGQSVLQLPLPSAEVLQRGTAALQKLLTVLNSLQQERQNPSP